MKFAQRFPKVAALLGANANDDEQRRDEGDEQDAGDSGTGPEQTEGDDGGQGEGGGSEQDEGGQGGGEGGEGGGGSEASASLAELADEDRTALRNAFTRDANALVAAERARCIAAFTSDAGRRSPNAAARLLNKTSMGSKDVIETLGDMGATSRGQGRDRLNGSADVRVDTGTSSEAAAGREAVVEGRKAEREKRNKAALKKGGVRANRTEFDDGAGAAE